MASPTEGGDEEAVIVAPDLAASGDLKPVVDRIGRVLGHTVARRVEPVIANVVHVGRQGQLVGCLPDDGHVIEITQSGIGIDAREDDRRHIRIFHQASLTIQRPRGGTCAAQDDDRRRDRGWPHSDHVEHRYRF